ncbi:SIMPL domain-containing protein [Pseudonocardia humida]|uniref:SIMPL domain-containing protein n=1 Tax=Pseudonocardia humida TaxID=2800819 RepID=A0ABT1A9Z2_9PSEU|nr:SIMPL domain-containing protein [Pseudonocardia humida]MCO1659850.1 SIMPL domain-containing protein [Pseudonocardia humida]
MNRALRTAAVLALGVLVLSGCSTPTGAEHATGGAGAADPAAITARGTGTVRGAPDVATLVLAEQTRDPRAEAALGAASAGATALVAVLDRGGIAAADRRTSGLSVDPTFDQDGRVTGYQAVNEVTATVRDTAAVGALVDAASQAVGDALRVRGITFSIEDDSELRVQARADAVREAQAQAQELATAAGVDLGRVRTIIEVPPASTDPFRADAAPVAATPVEPGTRELTVVVEVSYGIDG